jgi:hypothetical protein
LLPSTLPVADVQVLGKEEFTKSMLEKLIWICAFMLVGARHGGCSVGEVEAQVGVWGPEWLWATGCQRQTGTCWHRLLKCRLFQ